MFEEYKNRMAMRGRNMSEMLRMQSNTIIEHTWDRDPNARKVYVVRVENGLPIVTDKHELVDVKFNIDTYQKAVSDEPAYLLQFRHGAEKLNTDIGVGSYVYMEDEDGEWKWWLMLAMDERPSFRQYHIMECNFKFGWVLDGKVYYTLGVLRGGTNSVVDENTYTTTVNGGCTMWMPTNNDTAAIPYGQRFLISDARRKVPLCYAVANIVDTMPIGLTKFVMKQEQFNPELDNDELMLADYHNTAIQPVLPENESSASDVKITYNGTKPTVKAGGSFKTFKASFSDETVVVDKWVVTDSNGVISGDYTAKIEDGELKLKVAANYNLVGTVLTVSVFGSDGSVGELKVEVV